MREIGVPTVAGTYIGTVVGAGFASGQELLRFFSLFGPAGTWGILLATVLFAFFGVRILLVGSAVGAGSHEPVLRAVAGDGLGRLLDYLVTFFLFGSLTTMVAAAGAAAHEAWRLPSFLGSLAMAGATAGTVLLGLTGVLKAISRLAPLLIAAAVGLSVKVLLGREPTGPGAAGGLPEAVPVAPWWPLAAILYVSFNLVGAVAVLAPLGGAVLRRRPLVLGGILGALGLGTAAMAIHLALLSDLVTLHRAEVPMLRLSAGMAPWAADAYAAVLLLEVYTTAVASLFGLAARLRNAFPGGFGGVALAGAAGSLFASRFGFVALVANLYPLIGVGGLLLLMCLAFPLRTPAARR